MSSIWRDINFYLTVIGLMVGVLGVWLSLRHRYAGKISLFRRASTALFSDLIQNIPELAVTFKGSPVEPRLSIFSGYIINSGKKDFTSEMIEEPLQLILPSDFCWRKVSVTPVSKGLHVGASIKNQSVIFEFGLFRCKEIFRFEALVELPPFDGTTPPSKRLNKAISIHHRIADTAKVVMEEIPTDPKQKPLYKREGVIQVVLFALVFIFLIPVIQIWTGKPAVIEYTVTKYNKTFTATISPKSNYDVKVTPLDGTDEFTENGKMFFSRPDLAPTIKTKRRTFDDYLFSAIMVAIWGLLALFEIYDYVKGVKIYRLISKTEMG